MVVEVDGFQLHSHLLVCVHVNLERSSYFCVTFPLIFSLIVVVVVVLVVCTLSLAQIFSHFVHFPFGRLLSFRHLYTKKKRSRNIHTQGYCHFDFVYALTICERPHTESLKVDTTRRQHHDRHQKHAHKKKKMATLSETSATIRCWRKSEIKDHARKSTKQ